MSALFALDPDDGTAAECAALRERATAVVSTLQIARALIESQRVVDLAGLDQEIGRICAKALDLPPALGHALRADLVHLLEAVDGLSQALRLAAAED
jgi:hypothetical protein